MITTSAYLSTDAIKLAVDKNIDLVFLNEFGEPYGRIWHSKLGSTVLIRRRQLEIANSEGGFNLAKGWVLTKFDNQIEFLDRLRRIRPEKEEEIIRHILMLKELRDKMDNLEGSLEERWDSIMGLEGAGGKICFDALNFIMPQRFKFEGRSRQPAKGEFNYMLNYGYGALYSLVEKACIIAGLDPYVGFIYSDNYNKKSLVFDLIEIFRILVDRTVVYLFSQRMVKKDYFDKVRGGLSLNKEGKAVLIEVLNKTFDKSVRYKGRNIKNKDIIQFECHRIANELIKD